jgi:CrcB protein
MVLALAVGAAGAVGAVARYLLDGVVQDRTSGPFPFGTLTVNVVGSLVLGVLTGIALHHAGAVRAKTIIGAGFCGGLTTWSAASWEAVRLAEERSGRTAVAFTFLNLAASLGAGSVGLLILALHI